MLPTRITEETATLIHNIFINGQVQKHNSGNITMSIYLTTFPIIYIIIENCKGDNPANKTAKTTWTDGDYKNFKKGSLKKDLQGIDTGLLPCHSQQWVFLKVPSLEFLDFLL